MNQVPGANHTGLVCNQQPAECFCSIRADFEILDQEEEVEEVLNLSVPENVRGEVAFKHVAFGYSPDKLLMEDGQF